MSEELNFQGFNKNTFKFFKQLSKQNTKDWFDEHRADYENNVLIPAMGFVSDMGAKLRSITPDVTAIPKIDKSIFRLRRDTRFSSDKTPYKTHMGIFFWEGSGKKLENPGYYVQLNGRSIFIGVGMHMFPTHLLRVYRDAIADPKLRKKIVKVIKGIEKNDAYKISGSHYKRVPKGYDPNTPNAELFLHNGLAAFGEYKIPDSAYSSEFIDYCFDHFKAMAGIHKWLHTIFYNSD